MAEEPGARERERDRVEEGVENNRRNAFSLFLGAALEALSPHQYSCCRVRGGMVDSMQVRV